MSNHHYFYQTQELDASACANGFCSYVEQGDPDARTPLDPNVDCGWWKDNAYGAICGMSSIEGYFVVVKDANGESPRSNLIFFECEPEPISTLVSPLGDEAIEFFASSDSGAAEWAAVCEPDDVALEVAVVGPDELSGFVTTALSGSATLLTLGQAAVDPPYEILDLFADHLGSTRLVVNEQGLAKSIHEYLPFGEEATPMASRTSHMFTGHERDGGTGLDYMMARYYGNDLPRFIGPDPVYGFPENSQSWNRYAYVFNNPVNAIDPDGLDTYFLNRAISGDAPLRTWERASHQLIVTTDYDSSGAEYVASTIGWADGGDDAFQDNWVVNAKRDLTAARKALELDGNGAVPGKRLDRQGDDDLDPYVYEELRQRDNNRDHPSNKRKWSPWNTCRTEAQRLMRDAKEKKEKNEKKQKKGRSPNSYGIDPDGIGPEQNPCNGLGPNCRG